MASSSIRIDWLLANRYVLSDIKRNHRSWLMGVVTVLMVVTFTSMLQNGIIKSSLIFLKLSEDQVGEYDLYILPSFDSLSTDASFDADTISSILLNRTEIEERSSEIDAVSGAVPRWLMLASVVNPLKPDLNASTFVLGINSEAEEDMGLGRAWDRRPLGQAECYVMNSVLRRVDVQPAMGERVLLVIDIPEILGNMGMPPLTVDSEIVGALLDGAGITVPGGNATVDPADVWNSIFPNIPLPPGVFPDTVLLDQDALVEALVPAINAALIIQSEFTVVEGVDWPAGKWPAQLGNVVVLESEYLLDLVVGSINNVFGNSPFTSVLLGALGISFDFSGVDVLGGISIDEFAMQVVVNFVDRIEMYQKDIALVKDDLIERTNALGEELGTDYPASFALPLYAILGITQFVKMFLDQLFRATILLLVALSILLIFSLMLSNVEEKTYEYGMLRALGMRHRTLILLLLTYAMYFAIPGIAIGLLLGWLLDIPVSTAITSYAVVPPDYRFFWQSITIAVSLGLIMPAVSNYFPIRRALSKTLRDSLDLYHQVFSETTVKLERLEDLGLNAWQTAIAVMMVVAGFIIYYVVPLAFIFADIPLFLTILTGVLMAMVGGMAMVSLVLEPFLERAVLPVLLWARDGLVGVAGALRHLIARRSAEGLKIEWGSDRRLRTIIERNLSGHRRRNLKTAIMFTISLAFIVFAGSMFTMQARSISETITVANGADIVLVSLSASTPLDEVGMRSYLEAETEKSDGLVTSFTFVTFPLDQSFSPQPLVSFSSISNVANFPTSGLQLIGLEREYIDTIYQRYFMVSEADSDFDYEFTPQGMPDAVRSLYDDEGKAKISLEDEVSVPPDLTSGTFLDAEWAATDYALDNDEAYTTYSDVIVSEALRVWTKIDTDSPLLLNIGINQPNWPWPYDLTIRVQAKARAMCRKVPGFFFSSISQTAALFQPVLVSIPTYDKLRKEVWRRSNTTGLPPLSEVAPKQKVMMSLRNPEIAEDREEVINNLRNYFGDVEVQVLDTIDLVGQTSVSTTMILLFFNIVAVIAVIMCFFMLVVSFTANVQENSWEYGVLRALGLTASTSTAVWVYEALALIISSIILGTALGLVTAVSLTLQFNLFTEMPFVLDFPGWLFGSVLAMSLLVAWLGSSLPSRALRKKAIASVLKGGK